MGNLDSTTTPRMLDDGTEVPADDDELLESARFAMLYSLQEVDDGFTVVAFDRYGRSVRGHALGGVCFETPSAAFDAIREVERHSGVVVKASPRSPSDAVSAAAAARSA